MKHINKMTLSDRFIIVSVMVLAMAALQQRHHVRAAYEEDSSAEAPEKIKFIGWSGESYRPLDPRIGTAPRGSRNGSWVECVSWRPRACIYHNFLSEEECRHLLRASAPQMKRSTVVGSGGGSVVDDYRTSYGTFLSRKRDPVLTDIERRVSEWVMLPQVHQEDLQVLRYGRGQFYKKHFDSLGDEKAGARVATVLMYLRDVEEGGETCFPDGSQWIDPGMQAKADPSFSDCAKGHVAFKPKRGNAFVFWSNRPDGSADELAMHTGCPVIRGIKWVAIKWIHSKPFRPELFDATPVGTASEAYDPNGNGGFDPTACADAHPMCSSWAEAGECKSNPKYMVGDSTGVGACRAACGACVPCKPHDQACTDANRRKARYLVIDPDEMM